MKSARALFLQIVLFVACVSLAGAHAFLDSSEPEVGGKLVRPPKVVKIWFTRELKAKGCLIQVLDSAGKEVDKGDVKLDSDDPHLLTVSVAKLAAGTYKVVWTAVCIDTHVTHGSFTFEVAGP